MKIKYVFRCERYEIDKGFKKSFLTMKHSLKNDSITYSANGDKVILPGIAEIVKNESAEDYEKFFEVIWLGPLGAPSCRSVECILKEDEFIDGGMEVYITFEINPKTNKSSCVVNFSFSIKKKRE